jgi:hypothetical protein
VQLLPVRERVLAVGSVLGYQNGNGRFSLVDLHGLFDTLHIPQPGNPSATLGSLRSAGLVYRSADKLWSLTPLGRQRATELIGHFDYEQIEAELAGTPGAEFAHEKHTVIPPEFAPPRWRQGISRLQEKFPFVTNVFCMTRFPASEPEAEPDPVAGAIEILRTVVAQHGLNLHLASDRQADDELFGNVGAHMWACQYGIGLLETRSPKSKELNDNVLIELGSMLMTGRRCAILKDRGAPSPPTDLAGYIYKPVNLDDPKTIRDAAHTWLADDLGLGRCSECPPSPSR